MWRVNCSFRHAAREAAGTARTRWNNKGFCGFIVENITAYLRSLPFHRREPTSTSLIPHTNEQFISRRLAVTYNRKIAYHFSRVSALSRCWKSPSGLFCRSKPYLKHVEIIKKKKKAKLIFFFLQTAKGIPHRIPSIDGYSAMSARLLRREKKCRVTARQKQPGGCFSKSTREHSKINKMFLPSGE